MAHLYLYTRGRYWLTQSCSLPGYTAVVKSNQYTCSGILSLVYPVVFRNAFGGFPSLRRMLNRETLGVLDVGGIEGQEKTHIIDTAPSLVLDDYKVHTKTMSANITIVHIFTSA